MKGLLYKATVVLSVVLAMSMTGCSGAQSSANTNVNANTIRENNVKSRVQQRISFTRKIIQASPELNEAFIQKTIPEVKIIKLQNGDFVLTYDSSEADVIEKKLLALKEIRKIITPERIGIIKPITKIKVGKDFIIDTIKTTEDHQSNDPGYKSQWAIVYSQANKAWPLVQQKAPVKIAVVDTGVDYTHPDLKNRILKDEAYDFVNEDNDAMDDNGHGTHVSGIIAAEANNKIGISGIVGTLDVSIIPIKVLDSNGEGESDQIARGIEYAVDHGAQIINLSLGGKGSNEEITDAVNYAIGKGIFVVAAAGNDNANCNNYTPAGINGVYTVAAVNPLLKKTTFSNYGSSIEISSPGVKILSTVPGDLTFSTHL